MKKSLITTSACFFKKKLEDISSFCLATKTRSSKQELCWGVLVFLKFYKNFSECQILWSLCSVVFSCFDIEIAYSNFTYLWRLNSQFIHVQVKNMNILTKRAHPSFACFCRPYMIMVMLTMFSAFLPHCQKNVAGRGNVFSCVCPSACHFVHFVHVHCAGPSPALLSPYMAPPVADPRCIIVVTNVLFCNFFLKTT